jgi:N-glycosylase/DNA lyase
MTKSFFRASSFVTIFRTVIKIPASDFDLAKTLDSGQVFHWQKIDNGFVGAIGDCAVYVEQQEDLLRAKFGAGKLDRLNRSSFERLVTNYFALDHPLAAICASFPDDPTMRAARAFCHGLRIIRQPKWECLATFICSSMKQVAHIRQISLALRERFGAPRKICNHIVYTFPSPERLGASSENELRKCALGYRAKNLLATARLVANGDACRAGAQRRRVDLKAMRELPDADLREALCALPGVGAKVANCVMLFAYERLRAFPIDVWIERVLREKYFPRVRKLNAARLRAFTEGYFGSHGGYAQQYLFHHARMSGSKIKRKRKRTVRNDNGARVR